MWVWKQSSLASFVTEIGVVIEAIFPWCTVIGSRFHSYRSIHDIFLRTDVWHEQQCVRLNVLVWRQTSSVFRWIHCVTEFLNAKAIEKKCQDRVTHHPSPYNLWTTRTMNSILTHARQQTTAPNRLLQSLALDPMKHPHQLRHPYQACHLAYHLLLVACHLQLDTSWR